MQEDGDGARLHTQQLRGLAVLHAFHAAQAEGFGLPRGKLPESGPQSLDKLPRLRKYDMAVIANVFGETEGEYVEVCRKLDQAEGVAAIELKRPQPSGTSAGSARISTKN